MDASTVDFKALHDLFRPRVLRFLAHLAGESEAEDLTQSVMLKVNQGYRSFAAIRAFPLGFTASQPTRRWTSCAERSINH